MEKEKVYNTIRDRIKEIRTKLDDQGINVWLRPETTGKETQFGSYTELFKISQEIEKVLPVIDFSHIHARTGSYNTKEEFTKILEAAEEFNGRGALDNMHIHLSGINYTEKGERNHLILEESDMNFKELIETWKNFKIKGVVISESPNIEDDALLMKQNYSSSGL